MKSELVEIIKQATAEAVEAVYEVFKEDIEPLLLEFGPPSKVIGPYEEWDQGDFQKAFAIYGKDIEEYIKNKEVPLMYEEEKEALGG